MKKGWRDGQRTHFLRRLPHAGWLVGAMLACALPTVAGATCRDVRTLLRRGFTIEEAAAATGMTIHQAAACSSGARGRTGGATGPAPLGAAGPPPLGSAGPAPLGSAGPAPLGAAGPAPRGAAGPPPIGAAGPAPGH